LLGYYHNLCHKLDKNYYGIF